MTAVKPQFSPPAKVLVVASLAWSLINFRGELIRTMVAAGHRVIAAAPDADPDVTAALAAMGVELVRVPMQRASISPLADLATLHALVGLIRRERPDVVLAYTQKPIVYAGIAARLVGHGSFFAMMSGLGYAFTDAQGLKSRLVRVAVAALYRVALGRAQRVFVFNADDEPDMRRHGMVPDAVPVTQVPGSGIDTQRFPAQPLPTGPVSFLLVGRLLEHKGLRDFVAAARLLRDRYPDARFRLLGPPDPNPSGLSLEEVRLWEAEGLIEYLGETRDVRPFLSAASVFVLPTWYREGLPRSILEAMATGRPVIATDAPGCRDAVVDGTTGLLVPPRNPEALAAAMQRFLDEPHLAAGMGAAGRSRAEAQYDVRLVNRQLLEHMSLDRPAQSPLSRAA